MLKGIILKIPSDDTIVESVQTFVEKIGIASGVSEEDVTGLSISVMEVVKNAMEHGNGGDPTKLVTIYIDVYSGRIQFMVDDCGSWQPEADLGHEPAEGDALISSRGRGVLIARNLARWLDYGLNPEGKTRATLIWPLS
ncbi:MAG: ATP-binding protein [Candidatus Fermentibacteria bacterium]|nr:ATP-binding protein [Candidatus Fermentibacteria bacterium]